MYEYFLDSAIYLFYLLHNFKYFYYLESTAGPMGKSQSIDFLSHSELWY